MKSRMTSRGLLGLLVGLAAAAGWAAAGPPAAPAGAQPPPDPSPPSFAPTERIDVEQAVDFPYDI